CTESCRSERSRTAARWPRKSLRSWPKLWSDPTRSQSSNCAGWARTNGRGSTHRGTSTPSDARGTEGGPRQRTGWTRYGRLHLLHRGTPGLPSPSRSDFRGSRSRRIARGDVELDFARSPRDSVSIGQSAPGAEVREAVDP